MTYTIINAIFSLILGIMPAFERTSNEAEDSTVLKYVDLSKDSILMPILTEAMYENSHSPYSSNDKVNYFSLHLNEEKGIIRCYVTAHTKKKLSNFNGYTGYTMIGSMPVIITNDSKYHLELRPNNTKRFPTDPPDYPPYPYDPMEWFYIIQDDDYARFLWGVGWLWNKPVDVSKVKRSDKLRLTRPKRAFKPRKRITE